MGAGGYTWTLDGWGMRGKAVPDKFGFMLWFTRMLKNELAHTLTIYNA